MPPANQSVFEFQANDWLDYTKFSPPLVPEVYKPLVEQDMFRALRLDLKIQVLVEHGGKKRELEDSCVNVLTSARARLRKLATTVYADLVRGWQAEQTPATASGGEGKKAIEQVKKLNEAVKRLIRELPRDMRETAAKDLGVGPDEFITVSDCDYDVRLRPDLFQDMGESESEEDIKKANEKLKRRLAVKGEWLECAVVWTSAEVGRVFVAKPGKPVKLPEIKDEVGLLEQQRIPTKTVGKVWNTGSKLIFQFKSKREGVEGGKLPGGNSPKKPLKKMILVQAAKPFSVEVRRVKDYDLSALAVEKETVSERPTTQGQQNSDGKKKSGKSAPAVPLSKREKS